MNQRIVKEIRVLLPAFGLTLLAAAFPFLRLGDDADFWTTALFTLGCLFMGVEAFGNDLHHGTLSLLLIQPLRRGSIWREKMQVLGFALALSGIVSAILLLFSNAGNRNHLLLTIAIVPLCVFLTSPFWTLLLRNTMAAIVFTAMVPTLIVGANYAVLEYLSGSSKLAGISAVVLMIIYCGTCCWAAYRRFGQYELVDKQSMILSRELSIPARFEGMLRALTTGAKTPLIALIKKELRLQQVTFVAALGFCVLAIVGAAAHASHITVSNNSLAEIIWAFDFYVYVVLLPLVAGAIAVTEEKMWGVVDWHKTLPPRARNQWLVKIFVALGSSLLLGVVLPLAVSWGLNLLSIRTIPFEVAPLVIGQVLLMSVAIYAGSLSTTTARAILLAIGIVVLGAWSVSLGHTTAAAYPEGLRRIIDTSWPVHLRPASASRWISVVSFLGLCGLVHRFAFTAYRQRLTILHRGLQLLVLAVLAWLVTVVAYVVSGLQAASAVAHAI